MTCIEENIFIKIYALIVGIAIGLYISSCISSSSFIFALSARLGYEKKGTLTVFHVNVSSHRVVLRD